MALERAQKRDGQAQVAAEVTVFQRWPDVAGVLLKSQAPGGDGKRGAEGELPDKEKRDELPQALGSVDLAQVAVRTAGARHGGAQFRPDQAVAKRQDGAENPTQHGLRPARRAYDQGNGDERSHSDHGFHGQSGGAEQANAANEFRVAALLSFGLAGRGGHGFGSQLSEVGSQRVTLSFRNFPIFSIRPSDVLGGAGDRDLSGAGRRNFETLKP